MSNKKILQIMPETTGRLFAIFTQTEYAGETEEEHFIERVRGWALFEESVLGTNEPIHSILALVIANQGTLNFVEDVYPVRGDKTFKFDEFFDCPNDIDDSDDDTVLDTWASRYAFP